MTLIEVSDKELYNLVLPYINKLSNEDIIELFGMHYDNNIDEILKQLNIIRKFKTKRNYNLSLNENLMESVKEYCGFTNQTPSMLITDLLIVLLKDDGFINHNHHVKYSNITCKKLPVYECVKDYIEYSNLSNEEISKELRIKSLDYIEDVRKHCKQSKELKAYEN